jgi:eukaryotic-like serine/threonine-protein kinase
MRRIGKFQLLGLLGRGGMGRVYKVMDTEQKILRAMKILRPSEILQDLIGCHELKRLFFKEASIMNHLRQRHVTDVFEVGEHEGLPYMVQEYLCLNLGLLIGESNQVELTTRPLSPVKALIIVSQILDALSGLHESGLIHRDIKSENVMLSREGEVKIIDFGLSRFADHKEQNPAGMIIGSPYYAAPEQIDSPEKADHRADIYSAGVVLYRLVTGTLPDIKTSAVSENPLLGSGWTFLLKKALAVNPADRFSDALTMRKMVQELQLDWEKRREEVCSLPGVKKEFSSSQDWQPRSTPVHTGKNGSALLGNLNSLMQPVIYTENKFQRTDQGIVDHATRLMWSSDTSREQLNLEEAQIYLLKLNQGELPDEQINLWRQPTVEELLSLLEPRQSLEDFCGPDLWQLKDRSWLWSADTMTRTKSWIVDMDQGAVLAQDRMCRFHVLPVRQATYV